MTDIPTHCIYHTKSQLNTPVWGSLRSPNYTIIIGKPDNKQNGCGTGEECECEELRLRRGFPLACRVMCFARSSSRVVVYIKLKAFTQ